MPLMRDWVEITVEESLLIPVVQELLALAIDPNHVEVTYGTTGRVILAKTELADEWYRHTQKKHDAEPEPETEVVGHGYEVIAAANKSDDAPNEVFAVATTELGGIDQEVAAATSFSEPAPSPVKRGPGRPRKNPLPPSPPLSDGEES